MTSQTLITILFMDKVAERNLHKIFLASLAVKAVDGLAVTAAGLLLLFFSPAYLDNILVRIAHRELLEDPQDRLVKYTQGVLAHLSVSTQLFAGFYVLVHGLLNLFLVAGIYKEKLWAYWVAIAFISSFIVYQLYRLSHAFSPALIILTAFDTFFIFLTHHEYKLHQARIANRLKSAN